MAITKNSGRQELVAAYVDFTYADLTNNVAVDAMDLPVGAVVVDAEIIVGTAWNSATSDVIDIGDSGSTTRYATDLNIHTTGVKAATPTGYSHLVTTNKLQLTWTGVGAVPTAGSGRLQVRYFVEKRSTHSIG